MTNEVESVGAQREEFAKFFASIAERLSAAERRLEIKDGTLTSIVRDADYICVIKMLATVEPVISELIILGMTRPSGGLGGKSNKEMFTDVADLASGLPLDGGRASKLEFARRLDMIDKDDHAFVRALATLRNRYAHNVRVSEKQIKELCVVEQQGNGRFVEQLTYNVLTDIDATDNAGIKLILIWAFSSFLEKAETRQIEPKGLAGLLGFMVPPENQ